MAKKRELSIQRKLHYDRLVAKFTLMALDCFEWLNLPNGIESRFIEMSLLRDGQAFFFEDNKMGLLALPCFSVNNLDVYGQPRALNVVGFNYSKMKDIKQGVRIMNNDLCRPTIDYIEYYAKLMQEVEESINANVIQQRHPIIIKCTKDTKFTFQNLMYNKDVGEHAIYINKNIDMENIDVFGLNIPQVYGSLQEYKEKLTNEILCFFGLNNADTKKERMLVDEINVNNDYIDSFIELAYKQRKIACELINERYGLNVEVIRKNKVEQNAINEESEEVEEDDNTRN